MVSAPARDCTINRCASRAGVVRGVPRKVQDVPVGQRRNRSLPRRRATVCERLLQECPPVLRAVKKENPKQLGPVGTSSFGVR